MSDINFLDNAVHGKNSWGRYFLTIVISVIGGTFASLLFIVLFMIIYFLSSGISGVEAQMNILNYSPLLILVLVGISYGIYSILFYICIRFIHKKNFYPL